MRKREIMNQNYEFSQQIQILERENERLRICLAEADEEIEKLKDIIFSLGTKNDEPVLETVNEENVDVETSIDAFEVDEPTEELDIIDNPAASKTDSSELALVPEEDKDKAEIIPLELSDVSKIDSAETVSKQEPEEIVQEYFEVNLINDETEYNESVSEDTTETKEKIDFEPLKSIEPRELDYGSRIIGRIVINAANFSNRLTRDGETRYRELVNLILGKTEVAKAEILSAVTSSVSEQEKKQIIDSVYEQTCEYFESVMAQISGIDL